MIRSNKHVQPSGVVFRLTHLWPRTQPLSTFRWFCRHCSQEQRATKNWLEKLNWQSSRSKSVAKRGQICWQESRSVKKFDRVFRFSAMNRGWSTWVTTQGRKVGHGFLAAVACMDMLVLQSSLTVSPYVQKSGTSWAVTQLDSWWTNVKRFSRLARPLQYHMQHVPSDTSIHSLHVTF